MLGFLVYIDTLNVPYVFALLVAFYAILFRRHQCSLVMGKNASYIKVFVVFLVLCTLNDLIHGFQGIPNMYMQVFMLATAFALNREDAKVFLILTCLECFVGIAEYSMGITSFIGADPEAFAGEELLYFKRVYGISGNSSTLSEKVLISSILLYNLRDEFKRIFKISILAVLLIGFFITFNRTAIIAFVFFAVCVFYQRYKNQKKRLRGVIILLTVTCIIPLFFVFWSKFGDLISLQFSRGGDTESMLTGRPYIWSLFGKFISENFILGNGSVHLLVPYYSGMIHSHNSFIQLLADNGIILAVFYLINIAVRFNKNNWIYCLPFVIMSLAQYTLFWGFSMGDVFFFAFLLNPYILNGTKIVVSRTRKVVCT